MSPTLVKISTSFDLFPMHIASHSTSCHAHVGESHALYKFCSEITSAAPWVWDTLAIGLWEALGCGHNAPRCGTRAHHGREGGPPGCYSRTPCADAMPLGAVRMRTTGGREAPQGATLAHHVRTQRPLGAGRIHAMAVREAPQGAGASNTVGNMRTPGCGTSAHRRHHAPLGCGTRAHRRHHGGHHWGAEKKVSPFQT